MITAPRPSVMPRQRVDHNDLSALAERLLRVSQELSDMSDDVANSKVVKEAHSDRAKLVLAKAMRQDLKDGDSAAKAESLARSSDAYEKGLTELHDELIVAEKALATHEAKRIEWESVRSCLSTLKTTAGNV